MRSTPIGRRCRSSKARSSQEYEAIHARTDREYHRNDRPDYRKHCEAYEGKRISRQHVLGDESGCFAHPILTLQLIAAEHLYGQFASSIERDDLKSWSNRVRELQAPPDPERGV